jgi:putative ABC transport system permease protein
VALCLGSLAVAFGTEAMTFVATYRTAKQADARAAFGADLRVTPAADRVHAVPDLGATVAAVTEVRSIPARAGSDRKTIMAVDPATYPQATSSAPQIIRGGGLDALRRDRRGVLVADEVAKTFALRPGDTLPVTIFPDDLDLSRKLSLHVVGVFRAFPPTDPLSEMVMTTTALPAPVPPPDFYLARVAPGRSPASAAAEIRRRPASHDFAVTTLAHRLRAQQRTLTALNLQGLSRIEATAAGLVAAVGVGLLGAFLILERGREIAVLRAVGAGTAQVLTGPLTEGAVAVAGSLLIGLPIGLGLGLLAVRVLGLFFILPPPLLTVPVVPLAIFALAVFVGAGMALAVSMRRIAHVEPAAVLRDL